MDKIPLVLYPREKYGVLDGKGRNSNAVTIQSNEISNRQPIRPQHVVQDPIHNGRRFTGLRKLKHANA
jgi:hypothetical protein